jgi:hypothetical protein
MTKCDGDAASGLGQDRRGARVPEYVFALSRPVTGASEGNGWEELLRRKEGS